VTPGSSPIRAYREGVAKESSRGLGTEHSYRPALVALVEAFEAGVAAVNDPRHVAAGAPDVAVVRDTTHGPVRVGHIETKPIGTDLVAEEVSDQMTRYRSGLENLILTDYVEFRWYRSGVFAKSVRLGSNHKGEIRWEPGTDAELARLLTAFLAHIPPAVSDAKELAVRMAKLARLLAYSVGLALPLAKPGTMLPQLKQALTETLLPEITDGAFADMFAQTLSYGLFAARVNHTGPGLFRRQDAAREIPRSNPFLRRLFEAVTGVDLDEEPFVYLVDDLAQLLAATDMTAVLAKFGKTTRQEDPVVHFYETFLHAYDEHIRDIRGVYYTPTPVVSYLVGSADHILRSDFGLADGLADQSKTVVPVLGESGETENVEIHKVLVLDPACGTGTFLYAIVDLVRDRMKATGNAGQWASYVAEHLIPRLYGFELLMAPYAIAHLKLGMELAALDLPPAERLDWAAPLNPGQRLNIFLTNSLEEAVPKSAVLLGGYISDEANAAAAVKKELPILVVIGNPPYQGNSANRSWHFVETTRAGKIRRTKEKTFIGRLVDDYYRLDGGDLGERNPKWLQDDYVKFIRFGQWRIEQSGEGILAFITNHAYLDNPTFRGMRQQLMNAFSDIYVLDLHGSSAKREHGPDGEVDRNVFDIMRGVAISVFVRKKDGPFPAKVHHAEIWGSRESKYDWLSTNSLATTGWTTLSPTSPDYSFVPVDSALSAEWVKGILLPDAMPVNSVGIVTSRDALVFDFDKAALLAKIEAFIDPKASDDQARLRTFGESDPGERPAGDTSSWNMSEARTQLRKDANWKASVIDCLYRPFDLRALLWHRSAIERGRWDVMRHMVNCRNVGLISARSNKSPDPDHFLCTRFATEAKAGEATTQSGLFPLYLCPDAAVSEQTTVFAPAAPTANFSAEFIQYVEARTSLKFGIDGDADYDALTLFDYIYALVHSSEYRERYASFLKVGFPRLFVPTDATWFKDMAHLGGSLRACHLLDIKPQERAGGSFPVPGANLVGAGFPRYIAADQEDAITGGVAPDGRIYINGGDKRSGARAQYFGRVSGSAWESHVGGYRVCDRWLRDRQGRRLSGAEIEHFKLVCSALEATVEFVGRLDQTIRDRGGLEQLVS
jgi:predicted helicase